jgi:hypothetical protein
MDSELIAVVKEISAALTGIREQMEKQTVVMSGIWNELECIKGGAL